MIRKSLITLTAVVLSCAPGTVPVEGAEPGRAGSTSTQAASGYSDEETRRLLADFDHRRWDLKADETMRFSHLNGPQLFSHAWVHRDGPISELPAAERPELAAVRAMTPLGDLSLSDWIETGTVDGFLVLREGVVVFESYPRMRSFDKHHWWSVRKALVGTVVAILEDAGVLDVNQPIEAYLPELADTTWAGTSVLDILDMTSGTAAVEADDPEALSGEDSLYYQYEASVGNRPATPKTVASTYEYVASLPRRRPPGEAFEYSTVNTFVLTWLVEKLTGKPFAEVISEMIWRRIGAESDAVLMVSRAGASSTINSTLRDLGRFGLLFTPSWKRVSDSQLVSDAYLEKIQKGGRAEIFTKGALGSVIAEVLSDDPPLHNSYQWDFVMPDGDFFKAGHNGQGLYVSPARDVVIAFFGSGDDTSIFVGMKLARAIAKHLDH